MPPYDPRAFIKLMFLSIGFLLICTYILANENGDLSKEIYPVENVKVIEILDKIEQIEKDGDKVYWNKITEVKPKDVANQYCYVKVIIKESDNKIIKELATTHELLVTVEEHQRAGGLGGAVAEYLGENQPSKIIRIGVDDEFGQSGTAEELITHYKMDADSIVSSVKEQL